MAAPSVQVCLCSFKDALVFGVASAFIQQPVIRDFFREMVDMGIEVMLESNDFDRAVPAGGGAPVSPAREKTTVSTPIGPAAADSGAAKTAGKEAP